MDGWTGSVRSRCGWCLRSVIAVPARMILEKPKELDWFTLLPFPRLTLPLSRHLRPSVNSRRARRPHPRRLPPVSYRRPSSHAPSVADKVYVTAGSDEKIKFCESIGVTRASTTRLATGPPSSPSTLALRDPPAPSMSCRLCRCPLLQR